ncbi:hypothetical protein H4Q26_014984 [Puccinia striiformis f. sp. tritici PST-130]|uniref:Uncharacterized protein n=1 Tax=Puccinia striiformis f. sp. tritici PST-78 TaxID=1165861 RepID=A0A0L0VRX7_9BASI|nr:hypothetical protein H4Q26_014984 [Puccinia striiformis f. sp. tritici PST-130]KNF02024.1 hypothetical protein PSTG_04846 [Puccinia striiformis f. sp. tritici PST-78]
MTNHEETYIKLQGGEPTFRQIIDKLTFTNIKGSIERLQWLNKLAHGQAIANAYSAPTNSPDPTPSYLLFVNTNHWVLATVKDKDGVQLILPVITAGCSTGKATKMWGNHVKQGLALVKSGES